MTYQSQRTKILAYAAMMTTFIIILGLFPGIPIGFIPVPIVLQNMGIMMAGELLGPRYGFLSVTTFLLLVLAGLPLLSGGRGGASVFVSPSAGYIISWLFVPLIIGYLLKTFQAHQSWWVECLIVIIGGVIFVDILGVLWLSWQTGMPLGLALKSSLVFIPGDLIKVILSVTIIRQIRIRNAVVQHLNN